jgi:hypothetical protein
MANNARLYPYSLAEAQRQNEVEQWLDSRTDNARCRKSIETAIIREFDDGTLKPGCAKSVIDEYSHKICADTEYGRKRKAVCGKASLLLHAFVSYADDGKPFRWDRRVSLGCGTQRNNTLVGE